LLHATIPAAAASVSPESQLMRRFVTVSSEG
jgi:hypothetical protein